MFKHLHFGVIIVKTVSLTYKYQDMKKLELLKETLLWTPEILL